MLHEAELVRRHDAERRHRPERERADAPPPDRRSGTAEDLAETIWWIANLPPHININAIELMPTSQSFAGFTVAREA